MKKKLPSNPDYEVTDDGKVYRRGELKYQGTNNRGYKRVSVGSTSKLVHRLVLETFIGPCPSGMEAMHLNGVRTDNRLSNLKWGTHKENMQQAAPLKERRECPVCGRVFRVYPSSTKRNCSVKCGSVMTGFATQKLSKADIFEALHMKFIQHIKNADIARHFHVSPQVICDIFKGRSRKAEVAEWELEENLQVKQL